ncbi:hypothetical protein RclHR1_01650003 [Rhizophagus clarus]|uniref:ribonuclease H n=1 Tax=Rhizophagus clarus TaxID=94130 RepID=A0A2Z6RAE6_9GLOM|nr:hypothetical protein RclHR1_01650003 [Rhizophagus clarus]
MQVTHLLPSDCYAATRSIRSLVKHKANFSRSLSNPILYLSQALGLINLSSHLIQCHVNNLFLMANSSTPFIQRLFIYRLMLIQFRFLIPIFPLMVDDWSLWSNMTIFKCDYITCTIAFMISTPFHLQHAQFSSTFLDLTLPGHTPSYSCMSSHVFKACLKVLRKRHLYYLSQLMAPSGSHLISWTAYQTAYIAQLEDKRGRSLPHKWYLDIKTNTTLPGSHDQLSDHYVCPPSVTSSIVLLPGATTTQKNRHWLVTLDGNDASLFGKQLSIQPKKDTCVIVHWISDCHSSPGDIIRLRPYPGCDAHVSFPSACKYTAVQPRCTFKISLLRSMILPTNCERIRQSTLEVLSPYTWADLSITVIPYYRRLNLLPDFSSSSFVVEDDPTVAPLVDDQFLLSSPVPLPSGSHYHYYTDGSLTNLRTTEVSMGWSWVQLIPDAGYLNSVATYTHGTIRNWPSSTRAEAAAIYAALSVTPVNSTVTIYTNSQAAIDGLRLCASSSYSNSRLFYKTTNFELWASIERLIYTKSLAVSPVKVKGHDGNYWNEFADSLANSAHHSDMAPLLPAIAYTCSHPVRLVYDNVVCESNPRRLFKLHFQATFLKDLLSLKRFQFVYCLYDIDNYVVDWKLTWFTLNLSPAYDASFQASHATRHYTFKFKLFLDDLPLLEKLKVTRPNLYIDLFTCRSYCDRMEDLMHLILCSKQRSVMHQILQSYQNHLFSKLREAGELADLDPTPLLRKLSSLSCWTISSSNWSSYALIRGCLPAIFIDLFVELSIPRPSAMKVVAAIHNHFIQKLRIRIWNLRTYDKSKWEDVMNITLKLKTTLRPSNLPATSYVPFSSLSPPTHLVTSRNFEVDWIKNSMIQDLPCGRVIRYYVSIVASTLGYYAAFALNLNSCTLVVSYYTRLSIPPDFSSSLPVVNDVSASPPLLCDSSSLPSPIVLPPGSHYQYYTDGSLINLGTPAVSMGWSWVQIIPNAGYLNSVATYAHGTIRNWPSSTRAEVAAIFAALSVTPEDSIVSIYTDSQAAIDVKGHDGNYWNEFADSLANSTHHSDEAFPLPEAIISSSHTVRLVYDDVICESNPRHLFKVYYQATYMQDLLSLTRFQFNFCLTDRDDYIIGWDLTWFTLNYSPSHDASFQVHHASRHYTFKFKLFLDDLPLLEKLKITRPDLYIDLLTCRSFCNRKEDLMHLILCLK